MPNPVRITSEVLPPIDVTQATAHLSDPAERIEAAHQLVHGALQRAVASMRHDKPLAEYTHRAPRPEPRHEAPLASPLAA